MNILYVYLVSPTDSISSVLYTSMAYHNFPYVKKVMIQLPYIEFRERGSLSINGDREGWFWRTEKMKSGLESLLETDFFFSKFSNKEPYRGSLANALRGRLDPFIWRN